MLDFEFHPDAEKEFLEAARWYDQVNQDLGDRFSAEIERVILRIRERPQFSRKLSRRTRRALTRTFPYAVVFAPSGKRIIIIAIMHLHREPGYWKHRLRKRSK